jgi:nitrogen-specific signal transduction histidine kinase
MKKSNIFMAVAAAFIMSAGIAHEINNPLTIINGNMQVIKKLIPENPDICKK